MQVVALSIAGSDPSGGAGIQADLKTFAACGAYGTSVITALTAQSTVGVSGVHLVPAHFVTEQLETLAADVHINSIKVGMLGCASTIYAVDRFLSRRRDISVVLDPVMLSTSGATLLDLAGVQALRSLLPRVSLVTPNVAEAAVLLGTTPAKDIEEACSQAAQLATAWNTRVLLKGGHLPSPDRGRDVLVGPEGVLILEGPEIATNNTHGAGCTLSASLASLRPRHSSWPETARAAKEWLIGALRGAERLRIGHGAGPLDHFWNDRARANCPPR